MTKTYDRAIDEAIEIRDLNAEDRAFVAAMTPEQAGDHAARIAGYGSYDEMIEAATAAEDA